MYYCPNCMSEVKPGTSFCTQCGTKLDNVIEDVEETEYYEEYYEDTPIYRGISRGERKEILNEIDERLKPVIETIKNTGDLNFQDIDTIKTINSWTREYQNYVNSVIDDEFSNKNKTTEEKFERIVKIFIKLQSS